MFVNQHTVPDREKYFVVAIAETGDVTFVPAVATLNNNCPVAALEEPKQNYADAEIAAYSYYMQDWLVATTNDYLAGLSASEYVKREQNGFVVTYRIDRLGICKYLMTKFRDEFGYCNDAWYTANTKTPLTTINDIVRPWTLAQTSEL